MARGIYKVNLIYSGRRKLASRKHNSIVVIQILRTLRLSVFSYEIHLLHVQRNIAAQQQ